MVEVTCRLCYEQRVKAWKETRRQNGLTEEEWPKPSAPVFEDADTLRRHIERVHKALS